MKKLPSLEENLGWCCPVCHNSVLSQRCRCSPADIQACQQELLREKKKFVQTNDRSYHKALLEIQRIVCEEESYGGGMAATRDLCSKINNVLIGLEL